MQGAGPASQAMKSSPSQPVGDGVARLTLLPTDLRAPTVSASCGQAHVLRGHTFYLIKSSTSFIHSIRFNLKQV